MPPVHTGQILLMIFDCAPYFNALNFFNRFVQTIVGVLACVQWFSNTELVSSRMTQLYNVNLSSVGIWVSKVYIIYFLLLASFLSYFA